MSRHALDAGAPSSGDRILIDTSQRMPVPPGIFVIWDGMDIVAKRIEHMLSSEPTKLRAAPRR